MTKVALVTGAARGIGLATINAAAIAGAGRIICVDKDPFKFDLARAFGANRTPQAYVLKNTGGTFTVEYIGTLDDNPQDPASVTKRYVDDAVTNLLAGKPVVITTTKAIGCAIKWKDA